MDQSGKGRLVIHYGSLEDLLLAQNPDTERYHLKGIGM